MNDLYFQQKCPYCFSAFQVFSAIIFFIFRVCNFWHVHNLPLKPFCNISKWYFYFFLWINPKCSCFLCSVTGNRLLGSKWFRTEQPVTRNTGVGKLFNMTLLICTIRSPFVLTRYNLIWFVQLKLLKHYLIIFL